MSTKKQFQQDKTRKKIKKLKSLRRKKYQKKTTISLSGDVGQALWSIWLTTKSTMRMLQHKYKPVLIPPRTQPEINHA